MVYLLDFFKRVLGSEEVGYLSIEGKSNSRGHPVELNSSHAFSLGQFLAQSNTASDSRSIITVCGRHITY